MPVQEISLDLKMPITETYSMLHDDEVFFVLERDTEIGQKRIGRLSHDHGAEELATKPSSASRRDGCFNDSNLEIRTSLPEHVGSAQTARSSPDNDNV